MPEMTSSPTQSPTPEAEIVEVARADAWQTALICLGLMGIAVGAFLWSASPWYVDLKQAIATWLIDKNIMWPLADNAPWFILTHYPDANDTFSWLDGSLIVAFALGAAAVVGGSLYLALWAASLLAPLRGAASRYAGLHTLAQALIPSAGIGVFLGLSATTITLLKNEGMGIGWVRPVRFTLLALAIAYLALSLIIVLSWKFTSLAWLIPEEVAKLIYPIDKSHMAPLRLLHFLALAIVVSRLAPPDWQGPIRPFMLAMIRCGENSLSMYCLGVLLAFTAHVILVEVSASLAMQLAVSIGGICVMVVAATLLTWESRFDRRGPKLF